LIKEISCYTVSFKGHSAVIKVLDMDAKEIPLGIGSEMFDYILSNNDQFVKFSSTEYEQNVYISKACLNSNTVLILSDDAYECYELGYNNTCLFNGNKETLDYMLSVLKTAVGEAVFNDIYALALLKKGQQ
jgi:hypothetical protein